MESYKKEMSKNLEKESRPYLAIYSENELPVLVESKKDFQTDRAPQLHNMAKAFANHKTGKLQQKLCMRNCPDKKNCTTQCLKETEKRQNEMILIDKDERKLIPLIRGLQRGEDPDTIVMVEYQEFACSGFVLGLYSKFFNAYRGQPVIDLRSTPLTITIFDQIYKWMVIPKYKEIMKYDMIQIMRAATFLEIPDLLEQCYAIFDSNVYYEFKAFDLMYRSRHFVELYKINLAMASRISKSTLIILCSREFLKLTDIQVATLISSSYLAVNSESEIMFGVLNWLNVDWPSRKGEVLQLMRLVRFAYLSPKMLCQLNGLYEEEICPFSEVLKEFSSHEEGKKLIADGIFHSALVVTSPDNTDLMAVLTTVKKDMLVPRRWVQDSRCPYHCPVTKLRPNMRSITYSDFVAYSNILQNSGKDYEKYLHFPDENEIPESYDCSKTDSYLSDDALGSQLNNSESSIAAQMETMTISSISHEYKIASQSPMEASLKKDSALWLKHQKFSQSSEVWQEWDPNYSEDEESNFTKKT